MAEDSGYLALRWNNHEHIFSRVLDDLRAQENYCDVTISCGGKFYTVHKFVLATCSEYFREVFQRSPCSHPVVFLKDVPNNEIEAILDFMYRGEVHVAQEELAGILKTAGSLLVKGLAVSESAATPAPPPSYPTTPAAGGKRKRGRDASKKDEPPRLTPLSQFASSEQRRHTNQRLSHPPELKRIKLADTPKTSSTSTPLHTAGGSLVPNGLELSLGSPPLASDGGTEGDPAQKTNDGDLRFDDTEGDPSRDGRSSNCLKEEPLNGPIENDEDTNQILHVDLTEDGSQFIIGPSLVSPVALKPPPSDDTLPPADEDSQCNNNNGGESAKKPFVCPLCGHNFTRRDNLANHLKTHTGDRPFMCQYCHKCFSRKDYLKQHERIHTGEKPYTCPTCDRAFTRKEGMLDHMRCHSDTKEFACDLCSKSFKQKCGLRFHKRNHKQALNC